MSKKLNVPQQNTGTNEMKLKKLGMNKMRISAKR